MKNATRQSMLVAGLLLLCLPLAAAGSDEVTVHIMPSSIEVSSGFGEAMSLSVGCANGATARVLSEGSVGRLDLESSTLERGVLGAEALAMRSGSQDQRGIVCKYEIRIFVRSNRAALREAEAAGDKVESDRLEAMDAAKTQVRRGEFRLRDGVFVGLESEVEAHADPEVSS